MSRDHQLAIKGRRSDEVLGVNYKIISLRPEKFFGTIKDWIGEMPFMVTDREKTIIDSLDLPQYSGGVGEVSKALSTAWTQINESKLWKYAAKIGNSAVAKRPGFMMETLDLGGAIFAMLTQRTMFREVCT